MKAYTINAEQIRLMRHALGITKVAPKNKRINKQWTWCVESYRNYYCANGKNSLWDELEKQGLANVTFEGCSYYYHLTNEGIKFMGELCGAVIVDKHG